MQWDKESPYLSSHRSQVWAWHHQWPYHLCVHALEALQRWCGFQIPAQEFPQRAVPTYIHDFPGVSKVAEHYALKAGIECSGYLSQCRTCGRLSAGKMSLWHQPLVRQDEHCHWAFQTRLLCTDSDLQWKWLWLYIFTGVRSYDIL